MSIRTNSARSAINLTPSILKKYFRLGIRELVSLKHHTFRSALAVLQLELIPIHHGRQHDLDLVAGEPPPGTRVSTAAELHLCLRNGRELVLLLVFRRGQAEVVEAQTVKGVGVRVEVWVETDCVGGEKCIGAGGYVGPVRKGDGSKGFSLEGGC